MAPRDKEHSPEEFEKLVAEAQAEARANREANPRSPIPTLASVKSQYMRHCHPYGGPLDVLPVPSLNTLESVCEDYDWATVGKLLSQWSTDVTKCRRLWPFVALLATQFAAARRAEAAPEVTELSPRDTKNLVARISKSAEQLHADLATIWKLGISPPELSKRERRGHLQYTSLQIATALAFDLSKESLSRPHALQFLGLPLKAALDEFLLRLEVLAGRAAQVGNEIDADFLTKSPGSHDDAAYRLVERAASIWLELTGRKPSANKVDNDARPPDFVVFCNQIIDIPACGLDTRSRAQAPLNSPVRGSQLRLSRRMVLGHLKRLKGRTTNSGK